MKGRVTRRCPAALPFLDRNLYIGEKNGILSNKIKCADCGGWFGSKVWHSTDKYRRVIYRCNGKYKDKKCQTPHVTEEEVKAAFVSAYNKLVSEKVEIIANAGVIRQTLCRTDALEEEKSILENEMAVLAGMVQDAIGENARIAQDQGEYQERYDRLVGRYDAAKARYDEVIRIIAEKAVKSERLAGFIKVLQAQDGVIAEFAKGSGAAWWILLRLAVTRDKLNKTQYIAMRSVLDAEMNQYSEETEMLKLILDVFIDHPENYNEGDKEKLLGKANMVTPSILAGSTSRKDVSKEMMAVAGRIGMLAATATLFAPAAIIGGATSAWLLKTIFDKKE